MRRIFTYLLVVLFFILQQSCVKSKSIVDMITIPTYVGAPIKFPKTYYVSPHFDNTEFDILEQGANTWFIVSGGVVKIELERWTPPRPFDKDFYASYPLKTIWKLHESDLDVIPEEKFSGLSHGNYIVLMKDQYRNNYQFQKSVFMHELGHQFGLSHIKKKYVAIMNGDCGDGIITEWDLIHFCYLYDCN